MGRSWVTVLLFVSGCAIPIIGAPVLRRDPEPVAARAPARARTQTAPAAPAAQAAATPAGTTATVAAAPASAAGAGSSWLPPLVALSAHRPAAGGSGDCLDRLARAGVSFQSVAPDAAHGVRQPILLTGAIGGVQIRARGGPSVHEVIDCRLALSLLAWAPSLSNAGVRVLEHYSIYRPGARTPDKGQVSGHARGLAIDAARFYLNDGRMLDVETDWSAHDHGAPCPRRPDEPQDARLLRSVVCDAVEHQLFQVVLTPHHDAAHHNHVHLEIKPEVDWTYVR
jgi:hypothetical protein